MIHILAKTYGWTYDYILSLPDLTVETLHELIKEEWDEKEKQIKKAIRRK